MGNGVKREGNGDGIGVREEETEGTQVLKLSVEVCGDVAHN